MSATQKNTLRLVQFNVENLFIFLDTPQRHDFKKMTEAEWRGLSGSTAPNKPLKKLWGLAQIIGEIKPDILMLNEVGGLESLENFNRIFLEDRFIPHLVEGNSHRGIDVGYLIRKDLNVKAILLSHKNRPLNFLYPHETQTPTGGKSHYFSRDVAELRLFRPQDTSPCLTILLTHLKSKLDTEKIDGGGRLRRAAELKTLVEIYNEVRKELSKDSCIVVAGDFNGIAAPSHPEEEFLPIYEKTDLKDSLEITEIPSEKRFTQVQITPSGQQQLIQIDYIFVSPSLSERLVREETFVYHYKNELGHAAPLPRNIEERALLPSDHYPVVVTVKLKE